MLYLRFTLLSPALYAVHNAAQTKIAQVQIHPDPMRPHTVYSTRPLSLAEGQSIAAFQP
jgi:hypothetical protein